MAGAAGSTALGMWHGEVPACHGCPADGAISGLLGVRIPAVACELRAVGFAVMLS